MSDIRKFALFFDLSASELLEFLVGKHVALSMQESSHFNWSPFVSFGGSETIHAHEGSLVAHERCDEVVDRLTDVVLVEDWGDEVGWVASTSVFGAWADRSRMKVAYFGYEIINHFSLFDRGDVFILIGGQNSTVEIGAGIDDREPSSICFRGRRLGGSSSKDHWKKLKKGSK